MTDGTNLGSLSGITVLAFEQLQSLPFATQLLGRLGADVVRVEPPGGELGRTSLPAVADPQGRPLGATFLRNGFAKRSIVIDLKRPGATELVLRLVPHFDVVAENFKPGVMDRLGLGYDAIREASPRTVYLSVSGFGVGDVGAGLFAAVGVLSALWQRNHTGRGQYLDIAMLDTAVAITDIVTNFYSMGLGRGEIGASIMHAFAAADGFFVVHVGREEHFRRLVEAIDRPDWLTDPRLATRQGWADHLETVIRPGIEQWARGRSRVQACAELSAVGVVAGSCLTAEEVVHDEHLRRRDMLARFPAPDGVGPTVLAPGSPIRMSDAPNRHGSPPPYLGEHTHEVLREVLGLDGPDIDDLVGRGIVAASS